LENRAVRLFFRKRSMGFYVHLPANWERERVAEISHQFAEALSEEVSLHNGGSYFLL